MEAVIRPPVSAFNLKSPSKLLFKPVRSSAISMWRVIKRIESADGFPKLNQASQRTHQRQYSTRLRAWDSSSALPTKWTSCQRSLRSSTSQPATWPQSMITSTLSWLISVLSTMVPKLKILLELNFSNIFSLLLRNSGSMDSTSIPFNWILRRINKVLLVNQSTCSRWWQALSRIRILVIKLKVRFKKHSKKWLLKHQQFQ